MEETTEIELGCGCRATVLVSIDQRACDQGGVTCRFAEYLRRAARGEDEAGDNGGAWWVPGTDARPMERGP